MKQIILQTSLLENNKQEAQKNRDFLSQNHVLTINVLGSPGAGKTTFLEYIIQQLTPTYNLAVIEGDLYTTKDAQRLEINDVQVIQVNTKGACHLDATMITNALELIDTNELDLLIIENIGNLVCPASYDLAEDFRILIMSVTEGEDKPLKYPAMFEKSTLIILNKMDLLPYTDFNYASWYKDIYSLNPHAKVFEISCKTKEGLKEITAHLIQQLRGKQSENC